MAAVREGSLASPRIQCLQPCRILLNVYVYDVAARGCVGPSLLALGGPFLWKPVATRHPARPRDLVSTGPQPRLWRCTRHHCPAIAGVLVSHLGQAATCLCPPCRVAVVTLVLSVVGGLVPGPGKLGHSSQACRLHNLRREARPGHLSTTGNTPQAGHTPLAHIPGEGEE